MVDPVQEQKTRAEGILRLAASRDAIVLPPDIERALHDAFGDAPIEDIAPLAGGRSGATLLSFSALGAPYVLRRCDPSRPAHHYRTPREMTCMTIAAEHGVAPKLSYVDADAGIAIMERIIIAPRASTPRGDPQRIGRVARTLRRLHDGPPFPRGIRVIDMVHHADATLRDLGTEGLPARLVDAMEELASVTEPFAQSASCHGDLNPGNLLETTDAVYFVDWETAGASDPFVDLAELGVFTFPAPEDRARLLEAYLGRSPSAEERARMTLARAMALGFYAAAFVITMGKTVGSTRLAAEPRPMAEVFAMLARGAEAPADVIAASLAEEMRRAWESDASNAARRTLAGR